MSAAVAAAAVIASISAPAAAAAAPGAAAGQEGASPQASSPADRRDRPGPVRVRIEGVSGAMLRNVRSHLGILGLRGSEGALERRVERQHRRAEEEIRVALEPFGLYRPTVDSELQRTGPGRWRAVYRIDPGPPVPIREADLRLTGEGAADPVLLRVLRASRVEAGEPLRHQAYERLKSRLVSAALSRGYLDAEVRRSRVEVDLERYRAHVRLAFETGSRYRFGEVRFSDTTDFSPSFYRRLVPFEAGEPYSIPRLLEFRDLLLGSGYFRRVEVDAPREDARDLTVPVSARVEVRPRTALSLGVGLSTDRGPRAGGEGSVRYLSREGDRLSAEARAGLHRQTVSVAYARPAGVPGHEELTAAAGFRREEFEEVTTRTLNATLGITRRRGSWRETAQLRVEREWFSVGEESSVATTVLPRVGWSRDVRDEALQPTRASRLSLELQGTSTALGSDVAFLQGIIQGRLIRSLHAGGRILGRVSLGTTAVDELGSLPTSLRFFAGGDESVRGYAYQSLGPTNAEGEVIGGRHLWVASLEMDQRVVGSFGVAAFLDGGTAGATYSELDDPSLGTGLGARWRSPVGPVRLDLAFALDEPGTPARIHLVVGPDL